MFQKRFVNTKMGTFNNNLDKMQHCMLKFVLDKDTTKNVKKPVVSSTNAY